MKIEWASYIKSTYNEGKYYISFNEDRIINPNEIYNIATVSDFELEEQCFIESIDSKQYEVMLNDGMIEDDKEIKAQFTCKEPITIKAGTPFMILYLCYTKPSGDVIYEDKSLRLYCKDGSIIDKQVALRVLGNGQQELIIIMKVPE